MLAVAKELNAVVPRNVVGAAYGDRGAALIRNGERAPRISLFERGQAVACKQETILRLTPRTGEAQDRIAAEGVLR